MGDRDGVEQDVEQAQTTVRDATPEDAEFIVRSNRGIARETEHRELDEETVRRGVQAVFAEPGRGFYLIAERGGERAGSLMVTEEWSDWRNGPIWWIQSVYVTEGQRGAGIYRALHEAVLKRARRAGNVPEIRLYVERDNERAQGVYLKVGMQESNYRIMEQLVD